LCNELRPLRPWPDETHLPAQHVEDLWQLVDANLADDRADAGHAWVFRLRPLSTAVTLGVGTHAAEFEHVERPPAQPDTGLPVQHWCAPTVLELDGESSNHHR